MMFGTHRNRAAAYASVQIETGVGAADPHKLVTMLFDGAILALSKAQAEMQAGNIEAKGNSVSKAIEIITNGLKASLDQSAGGDLAGRLAALYDYMSERLLYANLHDSTAALEEVSSLLASLRDAWLSIAPSRTETASTV
jgi:flagellar secretion chaperone FliS